MIATLVFEIELGFEGELLAALEIHLPSLATFVRDCEEGWWQPCFAMKGTAWED